MDDASDVEPYFEEVIEDEDEVGQQSAETPTVRTVTMANLYWEQGDRETALAIIEGILAADAADARALAWKAAHGAEPPDSGGAENALNAFLERITKEYGHGISRDH